MNNNRSKQNMTAWAIVAIIGLLGLNAYQWFAASELKNTNTKQTAELEEVNKLTAELEENYKSALDNLEELRTGNKELSDLIDSQKRELSEQREKINNLLFSKRELGRAKEEIAKLTSTAAKYVAEITKLKEENAVLSQDNESLKTNNDALSTKLQDELKAKEEIAAAKAQLASEKEKLAKSNEILDTKVDMASAIKVNFMKVTGFEVNDKGKMKEKSKAKDINLLKICFKTETNMVTTAGQKTFYARIINPLGETVAIENQGSGILTNKLNNTQVRYTIAGEIEYNNEDTEGCFDWRLQEKLSKGLYDIELYNNGFMVGKGNFQLK